MAERRAIFSNKGGRFTQIGYVEGDEAFDLSGRRRCAYNAASGNLCDLDTGNIIGHVSLKGFFVGASWMAGELFSQLTTGKADPGAAEMPSANSSEDDNPTTADGHTAVDSGVGAPGESENALLERAIGLVRSVFNKDPS
jgi:hypothetical protein